MIPVLKIGNLPCIHQHLTREEHHMGVEPIPSAWQAGMLPSAPWAQLWSYEESNIDHCKLLSISDLPES